MFCDFAGFRIPYVRHYNPRFVFFQPTFSEGNYHRMKVYSTAKVQNQSRSRNSEANGRNGSKTVQEGRKKKFCVRSC